MKSLISEKSCGIIIKDNKLLFYKEQKNDQNIDSGHILKLPWWKIDEWETAEVALVREFSEECGLELQPSQYTYIGTIEWPLFKKWTKVENGISRLQLFHCSLWDLVIKPKEETIIWLVYLTVKEIQKWVQDWSIQEIASTVVHKLINNKLLF